MQLDAELIEHTDMVLPSCPEILTELFSMLGQSDLDLRNVAGPVEIFWFNATTARQDVGEDTFDTLTEVLRGVMEERDDFQVWLGLG